MLLYNAIQIKSYVIFTRTKRNLLKDVIMSKMLLISTIRIQVVNEKLQLL